jgi:hypothetical protein
MAKRFIKGERVHIDADTKEWGRVCSDATVTQVYRNAFVQVDADRIHAVVTILKSEATSLWAGAGEL